MAKRTSIHDHTFSPIRSGLASAVLSGGMIRERAAVVTTRSQAESLERSERPAEALAPHPTVPGAKPAGDRLAREKRILLTASEEVALSALVHRISSNGATALKLSHLLRACILVLRHSEEELIEQVRASPPLIRPANGDSHALDAFERGLARHVAFAIRKTLPMA